MTATREAQIDSAFKAACRKLDREHPGLRQKVGVEKFAWERFQKACVKVDLADPRWGEDGPAFAYFLLLDEVTIFQMHARPAIGGRKGYDQ